MAEYGWNDRWTALAADHPVSASTTVDSGTLSEERFSSWQRLRREAASAELRADARALRAANRRFGKIVKEAVKVKPQNR